MRYFRIPDPDGGPDRYKACSTAKDAPCPADMGLDLACCHEVPRMPGAFERWDEAAGRFVKDEEGEAHHAENARLRRLSPAERHEEAISKALDRWRKESRPGGRP
jgi:hypothetical protein